MNDMDINVPRGKGRLIKFWSMKTLKELLREVGFFDLRFVRVGRVPALAKSMIAIARKS